MDCDTYNVPLQLQTVEQRRVNSKLGLPEDKPTQVMFEFLDGLLKK